MTLTEMASEYEYRKAERLAILTDGFRVPATEEMRAIAEAEAEAWLKEWPYAQREQAKLF